MNNKKNEKKEKEKIFIKKNIISSTCEYITYKQATHTSDATYNTVHTGDRPLYAQNIAYK